MKSSRQRGLSGRIGEASRRGDFVFTAPERGLADFLADLSAEPGDFPAAMQDLILVVKLSHLNRERIRERAVRGLP